MAARREDISSRVIPDELDRYQRISPAELSWANKKFPAAKKTAIRNTRGLSKANKFFCIKPGVKWRYILILFAVAEEKYRKP
jgi:hypothetical protein